MKYFKNRTAKEFMKSICLFGLIFFSNLSAQIGWDPINSPGAPEGRYGHSMVTLPDGTVILFGGEEAHASLFNDLYAFNTDSWTEITPNNSPPPARRDHQSWTRGDAMYIYGGKGENGELDDMWEYDAAANTWQQIQLSGPRPSARQGHTATSMADGSVLIFGGTDADGNPLKDFWKLNADNTFTQLMDAPEVYCGHSAELVINNDWLFVFGKPNTIAMYQISADAWGMMSGGPPTGKGCLTTQGVNTAGEPVIFIFGGKDINGNESSEVYEYNLFSGELTQRANMPNPTVNGSAVKISALPPSAVLSGLSKNRNINFIQEFDKTTLVFGGLTNGVPQNNTYTFSTQTPPDTIITIATADTVKTDYVDLLWFKAYPIQAVYYEVQIAEDSLMNNVLTDSVITDTSLTVTGLSGETNYYWQVRGYNSGGWGQRSLILNFYTDFVTGIEADNNAIPTKFELSQNYPNPFNPSTTIKYSIPTSVSRESSIVSIKIYDILGREVTTLVNEKQKAGNYEVTFDAGKLNSSVYFYTIQAGDYFSVKKMCLIK